MESQQNNEIILAVPPEPKWFYLLLSFLIFPIGILLGQVYLRKFGAANQKFGGQALLCGIALPLSLIIIFLIAYLLA